MNTFTAEEAQDQLSMLVQQANRENLHYRIISGQESAILLPEETYNNLLITLELLSTPGLMNSFQRANVS